MKLGKVILLRQHKYYKTECLVAVVCPACKRPITIHVNEEEWFRIISCHACAATLMWVRDEESWLDNDMLSFGEMLKEMARGTPIVMNCTVNGDVAGYMRPGVGAGCKIFCGDRTAVLMDGGAFEEQLDDPGEDK